MNFDFIKQFPSFQQLYNFCVSAENHVGTDYSSSVSKARLANEYLIKFIYKANCGPIESKTAFDLLNDQAFKNYINDETYMSCFHYIRKMGNIAVHQGDISAEEALSVLENLHYIVAELFIMLGLIDDYEPFDDPTKIHNKNDDIEEDINKSDIDINEVVAKYGDKMRNTRFSTKYNRDEKENKKLFLSAS